MHFAIVRFSRDFHSKEVEFFRNKFKGPVDDQVFEEDRMVFEGLTDQNRWVEANLRPG